MIVPAKLEEYLSRLDRLLSSISVSEKAEIITEIKSHVLEAMERENAQDPGKVLLALGEPEQVASKYLLERGLKPQRPPKHPVLKWVTIGFLGTVTLIMTFSLILLWKFTPLISVDDTNDRVMILGGLIDVNGNKGSVKVGPMSIHDDSEYGKFKGTMPLDLTKIRNFEIAFRNAKIDLSNSDQGLLAWECVGVGSEHFIRKEKDEVKVDLTTGSYPKCSLKIPAGIWVSVFGNNGKLGIEKPHFNLKIQMDNGVVKLSPDSNKKYKFSNSIVNGKSDYFESSASKEAIVISVSLINGRISKN